MKIKYRPEVDGLRAIAVIFVILYHSQLTIFNIQPFKGGFIGVDIFFVISGYLITSIILYELKLNGNFSFQYFYQRRIRRIIPVFFVVMIFSTILAWIYLPPSRLIEFSKSILYSIGFGSNYYFYESGLNYFEFEGLFIPFLHSWSLSVEEQYYIIFPILLLIFFKYSKRFLPIILIAGVIISLFLADYGSKSSPSITFYFIHTRMWELLAGSLLAYFEINLGRKSSSNISNQIMPFVGLLLIFLSLLLFYDENIRHPSIFTLPPIIGVCLIIWFAHNDSIVSKLISTKLFVGTGLISYSLYLWHYPIFSFAKISGLVSGSLILKLFLTIITFLISIVSYFFIERKFRDKKYSFKNLLILIFFMIFSLLIINILIIKKNGFPERYNNLKAINKNYIVDNFALAQKSIPKINKEKNIFSKNKIKVLIIGDSHGDDFHNIFFTNKELFSNYDFIKLQNNDFEYFTKNQLVKKADIIVFSYRWSNEELDSVFEKMVPFLKNLNKKIILTSNTNEYKVRSKMYTLIDSVILFENSNVDYFSLKNLYYKNRIIHSESKINIKLKKLAEKYNLVFLNKEDYLCDLSQKECDYVTKKGFKIFHDYGHHTLEGAKYLGEKIYKIGWFNVN